MFISPFCGANGRFRAVPAFYHAAYWCSDYDAIVNTDADRGDFGGRKGHELKNSAYQKTRNSDGVISGREYSGHALDQMQNRGIMSSSVENAVKFGKRSADPIPGRVRYVDMENKVTVITENEKVITVMRGAR